jgi:hypothetical protein
MRRARSRGYERGAPPCSRCAQFCARTEFAPARTLIYAGLPLPFRSTIRVRSVIGRLRFVLAYIVASQLRDEVRVLRQDAALERIAPQASSKRRRAGRSSVRPSAVATDGRTRAARRKRQQQRLCGNPCPLGRGGALREPEANRRLTRPCCAARPESRARRGASTT